jgi:hypothetical protein
VLALAGNWMWDALGWFFYSLQTGKTTFDKAWDMPMFDYLTQHPHEGKLFGEAMIGVHGDEPCANAAAYDFADIQTLMGGGGTGNLLATILHAHPDLTGILYDLPHVVAQAHINFTAAGVAHRCSVAGGNFFQSVPGGADAYLLSHAIHDWNERNA